MFKAIRRSLIFGFLAAIFLIDHGQANDFDAYFMKTLGDTRPPIGHVDYCRKNPADCQAAYAQDHAVTLTEERWATLQRINNFVNATVLPATDMEIFRKPEVWTLPARYGDCEDYVLLKRKYLIESGWPAGSLLATVVRDERGEGHAVLTVRTDRGDFILDNQRPTIDAWIDTPYTYLKRQSSAHPAFWEAVHDLRGHNLLTASTQTGR